MRTISIGVIGLILSIFILWSDNAQAQQNSTEQSIAVVDMQILMRDSKGAKSIQDQMKKYREKYKKELAKQEDSLREEEKKLVDKKSTLTGEEFSKERKKFEDSLIALQKDVIEKQKKLDKAFSESINELKAQAVQIIATNAESVGASLVLPRQNIIIVDQSLDITTEVMKELDKKVSSISVKVD